MKLLKSYDYVLVRKSGESIDISGKNNSIDEASYDLDTDYNLKLWKGKKFAEGSFNKLTENNIRRVIKLLSAAPEKEYFYGLPTPSKFPKLKLFDKKTANLSESKLKEQAIILANMGSKNNNMSFCSISKSIGEVEIVTSSGIHHQYQQSDYSVSVSFLASKGVKKSNAWDGKDSCKFFSCTGVGKNAKRKALEGLNQVKLKRKYPQIILKPEVVSQMLSHGMLANLRLDSVQNKQSKYKKENKQIWGNVSLQDNPLKAWSLYSYPFDMEGSAARKTKIVDNGVLKSFISDYNTAIHNKKQNTANASISGIDFSNIELSGKGSNQTSGLEIGELIGAHTMDHISTRFSVIADEAVIIRKGERIPVKPFMISGSVENILKDCKFIGKTEERGGIHTKSIVTNSINMVI